VLASVAWSCAPSALLKRITQFYDSYSFDRGIRAIASMLAITPALAMDMGSKGSMKHGGMMSTGGARFGGSV